MYVCMYVRMYVAGVR